MRNKTVSEPLSSSGAQAFSLGEILLAVVCLGLLLAPMLAYVSSVAGLGHQVAEQGAGRTWVSMQSSALGVGLDPVRMKALAAGSNPAISRKSHVRISSEEGVPVAGLVRVGVIRSSPEGGRPGAAGFELSAGLRLPAPVVPSQPLVPLTMKAPSVSPLPGSIIPFSLVSSTGSLALKAESFEGGQVYLSIAGLSGLASGLGQVAGSVSAEQLARGLTGFAWVEYAGELVPGAKRTLLSDGRSEWTVPEAGAERLVYPSERVAVLYKLDLGSPVLVFGESSYTEASTVALDYRTVLGLRNGQFQAKVDWPPLLRARLGAAAVDCLQGFTVMFEGTEGSMDGNLAIFVADENIGLWKDQCLLSASPLVSGACLASQATWVLQRATLPLAVPELAQGVAMGPISSGAVGFFAADMQGLGRIGRLSARNGSLMSTGPSLQLEVEP